MAKDIMKRMDILSKTAGICACCGKELNVDTMTIDHYIPRDRGGSGRYQNLYPLCNDCNVSKGDRIINYEDCYPYLSIQYYSSIEGELDLWINDERDRLAQTVKLVHIHDKNVDRRVTLNINVSKYLNGETRCIDISRKNDLKQVYRLRGISKGFEHVVITPDKFILDTWVHIGRNVFTYLSSKA